MEQELTSAPDDELNQISGQVIGAAIEVHRVLGPGFLESVYQKAMEIELGLREILFSRQHPIHLLYKGHSVCEGFLDLLVVGRVVVELKAVESLIALHQAQVLSYLRSTKHKLGLLINFNVPVLKDGIKRIAL